jgi:glutamine amidotransferase
MIGVVDYGMGNLRSVAKALEHVGADVEMSADPTRLASADAMVLPGVGAFGRCMQNLLAANLAPVVSDFVRSGRPFLGICVGMQILFEESEEFGPVTGLGLLPGRVRRLRPRDAGMTIPHMGWNNVRILNRAPHLRGVADGAYAYFVHSYYVECDMQKLAATSTGYGDEFASSVWRDNVFATQFHPEKSQAVGLKILENFTALARETRR